MAFEFNVRQNVDTDFTKVVHSKPYQTIDVHRPELSQAGKTILVTGGATGIGLGIVRSFIKAGAQRVIIVARRESVLKAAAAEIRDEYGNAAEVVVESVDQTDPFAVKRLWANLRERGTTVDVLVLNAASFGEEGSLLDLGADKIWQIIETNVRGPLYMVDGFHTQVGPSRKVIIGVSSQAAHMLDDSQLGPSGKRPVYGMTKNMGSLFLQQVAKDSQPDTLQVINFHPGLIHNSEWESMGVTAKTLPFDDAELPGSFAVWATTEEASFLHGRFVWSSWDIDEYCRGQDRERLEEDVDFLRIGINGLRGAFRG